MIYFVNKQARHSGDQAVARWPMLALDECDQVPGSCTSALGKDGRDETPRESRVYERLVNMLAGWEDLRKSEAVPVHYHKDTFAYAPRRSFRVLPPSSAREERKELYSMGIRMWLPLLPKGKGEGSASQEK